MEPWKENGFLVRFEHLLEKNEDPVYSQAAKFNIQDVFRSFDVESIRETTLAGNQWLNDAKRMVFEADPSYADFVHLDKIEQPNEHKPKVSGAPEKDAAYAVNGYSEMSNQVTRTFGYDYEIVLQPMQIRTFVLTLTQKV
jgi:lysosomal alpha-mannosidase